MQRLPRWFPLIFCSFLVGLVLIGPILTVTTQAQDKATQPPRIPTDGAKLFRSYCATCHGADARGHGPASEALKHPAPDLALISERNGGKFPYHRIKEIIEGKQTPPLAHGNREMPIWGPLFHEVDSDQDWGEVRLDAITKYLESIQKK